jgi:hypothetical protein
MPESTMFKNTKYNFSFTAASLRLPDFVRVASLRRENKELDFVQELGGGKTTTGSRMLFEYNKRIAVLTDEQLDLLIDGSLSSQKQIAFLSICKCYDFIRDFTVEVVREKMLLFDYTLTEGEFITFLRRKTDIHPELEKITDKTTYKIKQVTFKILEQADIISDIRDKMIQPQLIEPEVMNVIVNDNKEWLKVLLVSDADINNIA